MRGHVRRRCDCPMVDGAKGKKKVCVPGCSAPYVVVIDLGRDVDTNKRRQKWHSGYRTKRDAEHALTELLGRLDTGSYVAPTRQTFKDYLEKDWLPGIKPTLRESTFNSYSKNVRLHVIPHLGGLPLAKVDGPRLNQLYAALLEGADRRALSPRTVQYVHTIVHRALKDAVRWSRLPRNAADAADPPRVGTNDRVAKRTWTAAEMTTALAGLAGDRLRGLWRTLAMTGMRRGEALGLRWEDIDLDAATANISRTLVEVGPRRVGSSGIAWSTPKTSKGRRQVALDAVTVTVLRAHRRRQAQEKLLAGAGYREEGLVFAEIDGTPLHPKSVSRTWERLVRNLQLPNLTIHGLRHTYCTLALAAGVHPRVVQERVGHASVGITLDTYSHVNPAMQADAADRVAALLIGGSS